MHIPPELLPVVQITLLLLVAIALTTWSHIKRFEGIVAHLREIQSILAGMRNNP